MFSGLSLGAMLCWIRQSLVGLKILWLGQLS